MKINVAKEHEPIEDPEVRTANQNKCPDLHPNQLDAIPVKFDFGLWWSWHRKWLLLTIVDPWVLNTNHFWMIVTM